MPAARPIRIAFVCTGNTGRSVTCEALAKAAIAAEGLNAQVISRAVYLNPASTRPEAHFVTLLAERGLDIGAHRSVQFGPQDAHVSDLVLVMTERHKAWITEHFPAARGKVHTLAGYVTGRDTEVLDAHGQPLAFYRVVLAQLDTLVGPALAKATAQP